MVKLSVYVPASHIEQVKLAMFEAGAGRTEKYDMCAWQTAGTGQFKPLPGSDPFVGTVGELCEVEEYQLEIIIDDDLLESVVAAMKEVHPYEEPAFAAWPLLAVNAQTSEKG